MIVSWRAINKVQHGTDPNAACQQARNGVALAQNSCPY